MNVIENILDKIIKKTNKCYDLDENKYNELTKTLKYVIIKIVNY